MSLNINPRNHVPCCNSFVFIMCYVQSVQKYCFPLSKNANLGVFVAVVVVVAKSSLLKRVTGEYSFQGMLGWMRVESFALYHSKPLTFRYFVVSNHYLYFLRPLQHTAYTATNQSGQERLTKVFTGGLPTDPTFSLLELSKWRLNCRIPGPFICIRITSIVFWLVLQRMPPTGNNEAGYSAIAKWTCKVRTTDDT